MVLFVGWGGGVTDDLGEVAPTTCPDCHNQVFLHQIRSDKRISIDFVPMVPYETNAYLACPICRHGLHLRPDQIAPADRMRAATARYRRGVLAEPAYRAAVDRFWASLGVASAASGVLRTSPTIPAPATRSVPAQLEDLARLHAAGALTDDEFAAAKRRLLEP